MISLRNHQIKAVEHINKCEEEGPLRGGILCLKMGLGKTRVILHMIKEETKKSLIVCSKTVLGEWINECKKCAKDLKVLVYHREFYPNYNKLKMKDLEQYDVIITTYDVIRTVDAKFNFSASICIIGEEGIHKDKIIGFRQKKEPDNIGKRVGPSVLFGYHWHRLVTDESQKFCNVKTKTFRSICGVYSDYRWCLTGTPIRNDDKDMWALLFFCGLTEYNNPKDFKYEHYLKYKDVMLVMDYKQTDIEMPTITHHTEYIDFSKNEYKVYEFYLNELWEAYDKFIRQDSGFSFEDSGFAAILGLFTRLRQICIAPYLVTSESKRKCDKKDTDLKEKHPELEEYVHDIKAAGYESAKVSKIMEIIKKVPKDDKIVVFSSFNACLDLLHDRLKDDYKVLIIDGTSTGKKRLDRLNLFRQNKEYRILLCNFKVGSEGLNLPEANHVICVELWWSPTLVSQGISRCWRLGQEKPVHSYKILLNKSIEESIDNICNAKNSIADQYLHGNVAGRIPTPKLDKYTLGQIIGYYN